MFVLIQKPTTICYFLRSYTFITSEHPNFNASISEVGDTLFYIFLK
jgi:hypothetical protein